jgi:hypothetical protein
MNWKVYLTGATIAGLLACSAAGAQTRGGGSFGASLPARGAPMRMPGTARISGAAPARPISGTRGTRQSTVIQIAPNGRVISSNGAFANSDDFGADIGVPGLGFDYVHLAAVSGNFRFNPPGFGRGSHHHRDFVTPVFFGGYPYYSDYPDYPQEPQQPQIIVIQQPAPAVTVQQAAPAAAQTYTDTATPEPPPAPVREVGELILVRRDGQVLFASVFSVTGTQVQYVTPEGIRHTLPLAELDTVATQEMNEARGTTLQFHD